MQVPGGAELCELRDDLQYNVHGLKGKIVVCLIQQDLRIK